MPAVSPTPAEIFVFGPYLLLPARRTLLHNGQELRLGQRAFDLLLALVTRPGEIVDKEWLVAQVWPDLRIDESTLRAHVAGLRKTLGETGTGPRYIASVPSRGYCFVADVTRCAAPASSKHDARSTVWRGGIARLIGREATLAAIGDALPRRRLVTLTGPGGMGKTSVAAAVAARRAPEYEHGVHLIDLAGANGSRAVAETVATALDLPVCGGLEPADLAARLAQRSTLLVLDNCEHVVEAAAQLVQALLKAPGVQVLATSRQALGLAAEHVERLAPLAAPPAHANLPLSQAMLFPAVELFVERATASFDEVDLRDADSEAIADVCRRLDGIPLAIELVAAQIGFYGLAGLRTMLADTGSLSALGRRTAQPRHRSLRSLFDWSFELLLPREQQLLCQLSVFQGRFTLVDAVHIGGDRAGDVAEALHGLVEKSLLNVESSGAMARYWLLETARAYAAERLAADGQVARDAVARRHAAHCIHLARNAALDTTGTTHQREVDGPSPIDDVRAALAWALGGGDALLGAHLTLQAAPLFAARRLQRDHAQCLERALSQLSEGATQDRLRLQLLIDWGQACLAEGECRQAMSAWRGGAELAHRLGDATAELAALQGMCEVHGMNAEPAEATATARRYEALARATADATALRVADRLLAWGLHLAGRHAEAMAHVTRALVPSPPTLSQARGNPRLADHHSHALTLRARLLWAGGLPDQAASVAQAAVAVARDAGLASSHARALALAACPIAIWQGDAPSAHRQVQALDDLARSQGLNGWQTWATWYFAALARLGMVHGGDGVPFPSASAKPSAAPAAPAVPALAELLATFHADFDSEAPWPSPPEVTPGWCAPERLRHIGERMAAAGHFEQAQATLQSAVDVANEQASSAWALRATVSLARLIAPTHPLRARELLADALADCMKGQEGQASIDVRAATALAQRLDSAAYAGAIRPGKLEPQS